MGKAAANRKVLKQDTRFLVPGMQLAQDVYKDNSTILVTEGTILNPELIEKFKVWDIDRVDIVAEIEQNPILDPKMQKFLNSYNQSVEVMRRTFEDIRQTQDVPVATFTETANEIADNITDGSNIIDHIYDFPVSDDYTFRHSVNVSAIAALIATWLKYPADNVSAIALAGLLHDVGKSQLPQELLNQPNKLSPSDYKVYQTHTQLGYELVKKKSEIAESVLLGIAEHHEREDGSGYPKKSRSQMIHPYAKIIAVADVFDEFLTINCETPGAVSPYFSLDSMRGELYRLDARACIIFMDNMMDFLSGNQVMLTNKQAGRVVFLNKDMPSRSIVQLEDGSVVDLAEKDDIYIHYILK
ncbi:MAG: HD-GYP domain-containing protein [Selenomonadaceae bacterium]|jgi:putative nucleotidyltransferase with HDIG domain